MSIQIEEFIQRRDALFEKLPDNSVVILPSASETIRNSDVEHAFRQDSNFLYLTGFFEPDALLVMTKTKSDTSTRLFVRPRDKAMEIWTGFRAGPEGAVEECAVDEAFNNDDIDELLPTWIKGMENIYAPMGQDNDFDQQLFAWVKEVKRLVRKGGVAPSTFHDVLPLIAEQRLIKSDAELWVMKSAANISAVAHQRAMQVCAPDKAEFQLEAEIDHEFKSSGARLAAYSSIVASGSNACILHYIDNDCVIDDGDLILIDAGCELDTYASDITRTFPANGTFTAAQKDMYQLVLDANYAGIEQARVGNLWSDIHDAAVQVLTQGMVKYGLLEGEVDQLIRDEAYKKYYMHNTGHWLGMDVHDVGNYKVDNEWRELEAGMVLTVEPGIYIAEDDEEAPEQYRGIGIRIEDDVAVSCDGPVILSEDIPKEIAEIEAICQGE